MAGFRQNIILVYDKKKEAYLDKSEEISSIYQDESNSRTIVRYKNNEKDYTYNSQYVLCINLCGEYDSSVYDIFLDGELQTRLIAIGNYGIYYGLQYKGSKTVSYVSQERVGLKRSTAKCILKYFEEVAALQTEGNLENINHEKDQKTTYLQSQLKKIMLFGDSVLESYINAKEIKTAVLKDEIIYPFDVNTSQKKAIHKALTHNISIIQGPPGTGKTQSILNLIANAVYRGKSIGIVSNNNSAIENVKEKLEKKGYGFLVAHLGNKDNQERFFESVESEYEPNSAWELTAKKISKHKTELLVIDRQIEKLLCAKEELALSREMLSRIECENRNFHNVFEGQKLLSGFEALEKWDSGKLKLFKKTICNFPDALSLSLFFKYISYSIRFGRVFRLATKNNGAEFLLALDSLIYTKKLDELQQRIRELEAFTDSNDINELLKTCSTLSADLFLNSLYARYKEPQNNIFTKDNYKDDLSKEFQKRFPVIISTTHAILNSVSEPLDYIVIDESSQVDIITATLAFSACRNVIIVGDTQQLPHIVNDKVREESEKLTGQLEIPHAYDYTKQNIINSLTTLYGGSLPQTLLREHYRCNPLIIGFCNRKFYKGELVVMKDEPSSGYKESSYPLRIFRTVPGFHGHDKINTRQVSVIRDEILPEYSDVLPEQIGIISPYRNQANKITEEICGDSGIEADTIHKFQGREKKIIIFSTVANQIEPFMDKAELVNVAVSRAEDQFIIVTPHHYDLLHGSNIGDLIRYITHHNPYGVVDSQIVSCFDFLHENHSVGATKRHIKGSSRYNSENSVEAILRRIMNENPLYYGFDLKMGYPLYLMICNTEGLNEREIRFCQHRCSHVDFLIVNRCDNSFVLAIEVDGYNYHSSFEQKERDTIKDKALSLNNIELLRLSTRGDREEDVIVEKLRNLTSTSSTIANNNPSQI